MLSALDYSIEAEKRRKQLLKPKQPGQVGAQPAASPYGETPPPPPSEPQYRHQEARPGQPARPVLVNPAQATYRPVAAPPPSAPSAADAYTQSQRGKPFPHEIARGTMDARPGIPARPSLPPWQPAWGAVPEGYPNAGAARVLPQPRQSSVFPSTVPAQVHASGPRWAQPFTPMPGADVPARDSIGGAHAFNPIPGNVQWTPGAEPARPAPGAPTAAPRPPLNSAAAYGSQNPAGQGTSTTTPAAGDQDADRVKIQNQLLALKDRRMMYQRQEQALPAGDPGREQFRQAQAIAAHQIGQLEQALRYNPNAAPPAQRSIVDVGNARTALRQKGDAMLEAEKRDLMLKVIQRSIPPEAQVRAQARIREINEIRERMDAALPDLHGQDLDRTTAGVNAAAQGQFQRAQAEGASRYANARDDSTAAFKARADKFEYDAAMRRAELARVNADTRMSEQSGTDSGAAAIKAEADRVEAQTRLEKSKTDAGMAKTLGTVQADQNRETVLASSQVGRSADRIAETLSKLGGAGSYIGSDRGGDVTAIAREWSELRKSIEALPPEQQAQAKIEVARKLNGAGADQSSGSFLGWIGSTLDMAIDWTGRKDTPVGQRRHNNQRLRAIAAEMQAYFPT